MKRKNMRLLILVLLFAGCTNPNYPEGLKKAQGAISTKVYSQNGKLEDVNGRYDLKKNIF